MTNKELKLQIIEAGEKARILLQSPVIYQAKPACQIIPEKIKENKLDT